MTCAHSTRDADGLAGIVSSKALDNDAGSAGAPGQGTSIPLSSSNPPGGDAKKGQCC